MVTVGTAVFSSLLNGEHHTVLYNSNAMKSKDGLGAIMNSSEVKGEQKEEERGKDGKVPETIRNCSSREMLRP